MVGLEDDLPGVAEVANDHRALSFVQGTSPPAAWSSATSSATGGVVKRPAVDDDLAGLGVDPDP